MEYILDILQAHFPDTDKTELSSVAEDIANKLRGVWVRPVYQAMVGDIKLNLRQEFDVRSKVDGQLFEGCVVSVINPEPDGDAELVAVVIGGHVSRKYLTKINDG